MSAPPPAASPTSRRYLLLLVVGGIMGVPAALVAALFLSLVHVLVQALWTGLPHLLGLSSPPWYLLLGLPLVGGLIVAAVRLLLPGDGGNPPLLGLSPKPMPISHGPGVLLAALGTLPFGAVLGPELPVLALGSVVGGLAARLVGAKGRAAAVLSTAGSFSAMSALFGGPVVAGLLLMEGSLPLGAAVLPLLLPGLVAAAVGYLIFVGFRHLPGLSAPGLLVPDLPPYTSIHLTDLLVAIAVGLITALLIAVVRLASTAIQEFQRGRLGVALLLPVGGLAVGLVALVAGRLGANPQDVLFSGQTAVPAVVTAGTASLVLVLLVGKTVGYAISLGCGFRGGPIFPSIFLGVAIASIPVVLVGVSPTLAVAVGAAAGMAAQTRLVFAPLLFATLLVGGTDALSADPAAVLASVTAWLTMYALARTTLFHGAIGAGEGAQAPPPAPQSAPAPAAGAAPGGATER